MRSGRKRFRAEATEKTAFQRPVLAYAHVRFVADCAFLCAGLLALPAIILRLMAATQPAPPNPHMFEHQETRKPPTAIGGFRLAHITGRAFVCVRLATRISFWPPLSTFPIRCRTVARKENSSPPFLFAQTHLPNKKHMRLFYSRQRIEILIYTYNKSCKRHLFSLETGV